MSADFSLAHAFTARWEGGLVNHPSDPGGITKYGISFRWIQDLVRQAREECLLRHNTCDGCARKGKTDCPALEPYDFDMDGDVDADDIRACTKAQAAQLLKKHFWDKGYCTSFALPIAITLYDSAVNMGLPRAARLLQEALNLVAEAHLNTYKGIAEDGIIGIKTRALARDLSDIDMDFYTARRMLGLREKYYQTLCKKRPSMNVFLKGWQKRCAALRSYLAELERT